MSRTVKIGNHEYTVPDRLCDRHCNDCDIHQNRQFSLLINILKRVFDENTVYSITQTVCPNMTCCADCRIDDFYHDEDCEIDKEAQAIAIPIKASKSKWNDVTDKLPFETGWYLVYAPSYYRGSSSGLDMHDGVMFSKYTISKSGGKWSIETGYHKRPGCVKAWMPIPSR